MTLSVPSRIAWEPITPEMWNAPTIRHLLRRVGWTARPDEVEQAQAEGLNKTLARLFPTEPALLPKPEMILRFEGDLHGLQTNIQTASGLDKRAAQRELRERSREAIQDLRLLWLQMAAEPSNSAFAKWCLFLGDVYVVSAEKVRSPSFLWQHFDLLGKSAMGHAPALSKAISRSPAMELYLDLQQSKKGAPNENFARELFELFVLGEGHYTQPDIEEAARAFTGYRVDRLTGESRFAVKQHDDGLKTVFGQTGRFSGDDIIDLAYRQPAAEEFLPGEMVRFYLTDERLPDEYRKALGELWRDQHFDLRALTTLFFGSRLFHAPEFRGNFIKSPVQFYLGLVQDLDLNIPPLARYGLNPLRAMGQQLFQPPNVRGWLGGRAWINSSTLAARRQLVQQLFSPMREELLNADEQRALATARERGARDFTVPETWSEHLANAEPADAATQLARTYLAAEPGAGTIDALRTFLSQRGNSKQPAQRLRSAAVALLQTPAYQLC
jgi:uncharacterized protein (DUF1800 family)